jgi:hypothetical protein
LGVLVVATVAGACAAAVATGCGAGAGVAATVAADAGVCGVLDVQPGKNTVASRRAQAILTRRVCLETNVHFIFIHPFLNIMRGYCILRGLFINFF